MYNRLSKCKLKHSYIVYGAYHSVSWLKGFNNPVAHSLKYKIDLLLSAESNFKFYLKYNTFSSSLTKFSSTRSVQTRFVAPQKPLIDTFLVIKVIISYGNFIAIDPLKKFGARFSLSDFHGQKFSRQQEAGLKCK